MKSKPLTFKAPGKRTLYCTSWRPMGFKTFSEFVRTALDELIERRKNGEVSRAAVEAGR